MNDSNIAMKITNLSFSHTREKEQLCDLNFEIQYGEKIAIIGPNGSGKSTLLNLLSGFLSPSKGNVDIKGVDISTLSPLLRAREMTYLPQQKPGMNLDLSLFDFVEMGLFSEQKRFDGVSKNQRNRIQSALELFDLATLQTRSLATLSGGEFQRARLVRSFLRKPQIMLLDEASAALDIKYQLKLWAHIQHLRSHTIIAALHNIDTASRHFDRCWVFDTHGQLVADTHSLQAQDLEIAFGVKVTFVEFQGGGHWFFES